MFLLFFFFRAPQIQKIQKQRVASIHQRPEDSKVAILRDKKHYIGKTKKNSDFSKELHSAYRSSFLISHCFTETRVLTI